MRICFLSVAIWWAGVHADPAAPAAGPAARRRARPAGAGGGQLPAAGRDPALAARRTRRRCSSWLAYLLFNDGIQTVIGLSAQYGDRELELSQTVLISTILLVQFVAFGGALLLGRIAGRVGAKRTVLGSLVVWVVVLCLAFFLQRGSAVQFYVLGAAIGLVLGGTQALTRSLFAQMTPRGKEAEYFGLYEISDKGTSWLGTLTVRAGRAADRLVPGGDHLAGDLLRGRRRCCWPGWTSAGRSPTPAASGRRCCERVGSAVGAGRGRPPRPACRRPR